MSEDAVPAEASSRPRIRLAEETEYPAVGALSLAAYAARYGPQTPDYARRLRHPEDRADSSEIWVAEDAATGELVGTVSIARELADGELRFGVLATSPAVARRGVGQALLDHVISQARRRGAARIGMGSGATMLPAHALYRKNGFRRVEGADRRFDENGVTVTVWTFVREL